MANLSEQKKVELLENAVLTGTPEEVTRIMNEHGPFEFTARALGYAARYRDGEMVRSLLAHGATFRYDPSPAFTRKYATKVVISNVYSYQADYSLYILKDHKIDPVPDGVQIPEEEERAKILEVLHEVGESAGMSEGEILFYSILYGDTALREACRKLGICSLSEERAANIRCDLNYAHMDGKDRHFRDEFTWTLRRAKPEDFRRILMDILPLLGDKPMQMMPADLYFQFMDKKQFFTGYCAEGVFELVQKHTNLVDKVSKRDLVYGMVSEANLAGLDQAMKEKWLAKAKDVEALLEFAQGQEQPNTAVIACIMESISKSPAKKQSSASSALGGNPMSAAELKKIWSSKKLEDGSLMLTSYKGSEPEVVVPAVIGKSPVTVIGESCFSPKASGSVSEEVRISRMNLTSVTIPEGITAIGNYAFLDCVKLVRVELPESLQSVGNSAFRYCEKLEAVQLPRQVTLEAGAFSGCRAMADENGLIVVQGQLQGYIGKAEHLVLPEGITWVRTAAITGADNLKSLVFSKDTVEIDDRAVNFCNSLRVVGIYPATEKIARHAFGNARVKILGWPGTEAERFAQTGGFPFQVSGEKA